MSPAGDPFPAPSGGQCLKLRWQVGGVSRAPRAVSSTCRSGWELTRPLSTVRHVCEDGCYVTCMRAGVPIGAGLLAGHEAPGPAPASPAGSPHHAAGSPSIFSDGFGCVPVPAVPAPPGQGHAPGRVWPGLAGGGGRDPVLPGACLAPGRPVRAPCSRHDFPSPVLPGERAVERDWGREEARRHWLSAARGPPRLRCAPPALPPQLRLFTGLRTHIHTHTDNLPGSHAHAQIVMLLWSYLATFAADPGLVPPGWQPFDLSPVRGPAPGPASCVYRAVLRGSGAMPLDCCTAAAMHAPVCGVGRGHCTSPWAGLPHRCPCWHPPPLLAAPGGRPCQQGRGQPSAFVHPPHTLALPLPAGRGVHRCRHPLHGGRLPGGHRALRRSGAAPPAPPPVLQKLPGLETAARAPLQRHQALRHENGPLVCGPLCGRRGGSSAPPRVGWSGLACLHLSPDRLCSRGRDFFFFLGGGGGGAGGQGKLSVASPPEANFLPPRAGAAGACGCSTALACTTTNISCCSWGTRMQPAGSGEWSGRFGAGVGALKGRGLVDGGFGGPGLRGRASPGVGLMPPCLQREGCRGHHSPNRAGLAFIPPGNIPPPPTFPLHIQRIPAVPWRCCGLASRFSGRPRRRCACCCSGSSALCSPRRLRWRCSRSWACTCGLPPRTRPRSRPLKRHPSRGHRKGGGLSCLVEGLAGVGDERVASGELGWVPGGI